MPEGTFYQPRRTNRTALAAVVLMHGAAITALALAKMEVIPRDAFGPIDMFDVFTPKPPPPEPPKVQPETPAPRSQVYVPPAPFKPPFAGPAVEQAQQKQVELVAFRREEEVLPPADPSPPPEPKTIEPARARANLASYVSDSDYPASAIRSEQQGTTRFRLSVGPNGKVTDCVVTSSSGSPTLDAATCRLMKSRARFIPARDGDGKAVGDTAASAIRWVLPDR